MKSPTRAIGSVICIIASASLLLAACGTPATVAPQNTSAPATPAQSATQAEAPTEAVGPTQAEAPTPACDATQAASTKPDLIVGVMTVGPFDDTGWSQLHNEAGLKLQEHFCGRVKYIGIPNVPYGPEVTQTAELLISEGAGLIIDGVSASAYLDPAIAAHPEVKFISVAGTSLDHPANYEVYYYNSGDYEYLLGMAAGMLTKNNQISYVAPFDFPSIRAQMVSFHMGALSVNPNVTTHIVTLNSWFDPAGARQATETLIKSGVDVIGGDMDEPTKVTVAEENHVWAMGAYTDAQMPFGPEAYVNTYVYDFYAMWLPIVQGILDGHFVGNGDLVFYPFGEGTDIGQWGKNVPQDVIDKVMNTRAQILSGQFNPFVGPLLDDQGKTVLQAGQTFKDSDWLYGFNFVLPGMVGLGQ
jgi:basic membrane protein A